MCGCLCIYMRSVCVCVSLYVCILQYKDAAPVITAPSQKRAALISSRSSRTWKFLSLSKSALERTFIGLFLLHSLSPLLSVTHSFSLQQKGVEKWKCVCNIKGHLKRLSSALVSTLISLLVGRNLLLGPPLYNIHDKEALIRAEQTHIRLVCNHTHTQFFQD